MNDSRALDVVFEDIVVMCGKIFADHECYGHVRVDDLASLRDDINLLRHTIALGSGYKSVPKLVRPGEDVK